MSATVRLFLYGTLIGDSETAMARWLAPRLHDAERASVRGRLVAVRARGGWFPALIPDASGARVWGFACAARLAPGDLARLDRYEGRAYRRAGVPVHVGGKVRAARAFLWRAPVPAGALPIAGGDFLDWLAGAGRVPLAG